DKGFEWQEDEGGTVYKSTPMSPEVKEAVEQLRLAFVQKHGREPGPDDLLFPDMPYPEHLEAMMVEDMKAAGLDPAFIYAFEMSARSATWRRESALCVAYSRIACPLVSAACISIAASMNR